MTEQEFYKGLKQYMEFNDTVSTAIDYGTKLNSFIDSEYINDKWQVDGDTLIIYQDTDVYHFTMSSLGAMGKEFFMGNIGSIVLTMCYADRWDDTSVLVLKSENEIKTEE